MTRPFALSSVFFIVLLATACNDAKEPDDKKKDPDEIYFDYKIGAEEGDSIINILLQYRYGGPHNSTLKLDSPATVEVDGILLRPDSSRYTGVYYEMQMLLHEAEGMHTITYTDIKNRVYKEEFEFNPIALSNAVPDTMERGDWIIELEGLEPEDYVRVVLTDTSRYYDGINRVDTVMNGRVMISRLDLQGLATGIIHLELIKEYERPVNAATPEGGMLSVSYGLRREFYLRD